jgi:carbon-monoxide dehydrogenase large subunit
MEPRAVLAKAEAGTGRLTVWVSTQFPHTFRTLLAEALSLPESDVHVIAPDVGGGFGCKLQLYPEELLVPWAARQLRRPVRWVETRREHLAATVHGRGQAQQIKVGFNNDGRIIALKAKIFCDLGAYLYFFTPVIPRFTGFIMNGCYDIEALEFEVIGCFTNKIATDAYRGAGRPEAICIAERVVEVVAETLGLDPVEVRRRNFIREFPARTATGFVYENGDYHASLDRLLVLSGYDALRREQARQRAEGRLIGLGLATYMEVGGLAPSRMRAPNLGGWESCTIRVDPTGSVTVLTGASPHGQGLATAFSQIVADELGVALGAIRVLHGDTDVVPYGNGTMGSRSLAIGGGALLMSLSKVKDKARRVAALLLEAEPDGITYDGGGLFVTDRPERKVSFAEVAARANDFKFEQPTTGLEPGLEATSRYEPETVTYPFGAHLAMVEIDPETGEVRLLRYYGVDDCGRVINPLIVEGQVHGGIAQGVGQVLFEHMVYDETGQLLSGTLMDYAIPRADTMPSVLVLEHMETPNLRNPLGVKGAGEAGTIGSVSAVYNAILDALAPRGVRQADMPLLPRRVWDLLHPHART